MTKPSSRGLRWSRFLPVLLYLAISFAFVAPAVLTGGTFGAVDIVEQFAPYQERNADLYQTDMPLQGDQAIQLVLPTEFWSSARDGDLQLWEPDIAGGTPLGTGLWNRILSPVNLLPFAVLPARHAPTGAAFLGVLIAQLGTHLLARRLGLSRRAAMIAAVGYGLGGPVVVFTHRFHEAMLAPLLLALVDGALTTRGPRAWLWAAAAGLTTAGVLLGGFPATALMTMYAAGLLAVVRLVGRRREPVRAVVRDGARLLGAVAAGGLIASVQLLPSREFLAATVLTERRFGVSAIPQEYLATGVAGRFFGSYQDDDLWWPELLNAIEGQMTIGMTLLAGLVLLAVLGTRSRLHLPRVTEVMIAVTSVVMLHASFVGGIVQATFQRLPLLDQTLFTRSRFLASLAIALLGAVAIDRFLTRDPSGEPPSWWLRGASIYVTGLVGYGTVLATLAADERSQLREILRDVLPLAFLVGVVAVGALWRPRATVVGLAIPAVLAVELLVGARGLVPVSPEGAYPDRDPAFDVLAESVGPGGQYRYLDPPNLAAFGHTGALLDLKDAMAHWPVPGPYQQLFETAGPSVAAASAGKAVFEPVLGDDVPPDSPTLDAVAAGWWLTDLETMPIGLDDPVATTPLAGDRVRIEVPTGVVVRALEVGPILDRPVGCVTGWWQATVTTPDGGEVVVRRTLRNIVPAGFATFPLPDVTATALTVELAVDGPCEIDASEAVATLRPRADDAVLELRGVDGWQAYRRPDARPRLELVTEVDVITDASARLDALAERDPDGAVVAGQDVGPFDATRTQARFVLDANDEVVVDTATDGTALLVLRDNLAPGWSASIDGTTVPIVGVDHAFRGVVVPEGEHRVHFRYAPASLRLGLLLAIIGAMVLAGMAIAGRRPTRSEGRGGASDPPVVGG